MNCEHSQMKDHDFVVTDNGEEVFLQRSIRKTEVLLPLIQVPSGDYIAFFDPKANEELGILGAMSIRDQLSQLMTQNGNRALCVVTPPSSKSAEMVAKGVEMLNLGEKAVVIILRGGKKGEYVCGNGSVEEYTPITGREKIIEVSPNEIELVRKFLGENGVLFVFGDDVFSSGATFRAANKLFKSFLERKFDCVVAVGREGVEIPDSGEDDVFYEIKLPVISKHEIEEQLEGGERDDGDR
jgi:hypothetical protein